MASYIPIRSQDTLPTEISQQITYTKLISRALLLIGVFLLGQSTVQAQQFNLQNDTWELLTLPADIEDLPVETIFGSSLNPAEYKSTWALFVFDAVEQTYRELDIGDTIAVGDAFWIKQITGEEVALEIPAGLTEPEGSDGSGCVVVQGCFEKPLSNQNLGLGDFGYNMIGSPFNRDTPVSELQVLGGNPDGPCFDGCSFQEAVSLGVIANVLFSYDSASGVYETLTQNDILSPWKGFWTGPLVESEIENPALVFPASADSDNPCDGVVGETDLCPFPTIEVNSSPFQLELVVGDQVNVATTVDFNTVRSDFYSVAVVQSVTGSDTAGLNISPSIQPGFVANADQTTVDNQVFSALAEGTYEVSIVATINETQASDSSTIFVNVVNTESSSLTVLSPGIIPAVIDGSQPSQVKLTSFVTADAADGDLLVSVSGDLNVSLADDGIAPDLAQSDTAFTGLVDIPAGTIADGECLVIFTTATQGGQSESSDSVELCSSVVPGIPSPPNFSLAVTDPDNETSIIPNEILVSFIDSATDAQKLQAADAVEGVIVGSIPPLNIVQIRLIAGSLDGAQLDALITVLENFSFVEFAEAVELAEAQAVSPNDSQFASQDYLPQIRADEAWTIARGGVTIAVVDTGIDSDHPDLDGKIVGGHNLIDPGTFPEDDNSHGTHVAGIAAAESNNGAGIAGVAWASKVLPIKSCNASGKCSTSDIAAGISHAADSGARVINASLRKKSNGFFGLFNSNEKTICKAVDYATSKGSIVVAAAGNDSSSDRVFPAACDNAYAVGNVISTDQRYVNPIDGSNFGSWVDIAAPGVGILSTLPGGNYGPLTGTSMSAPVVAGAVAVLLSREALSNSAVRERLDRTAVPLATSANLGAGRIDLFEAVFNGSFEEGNLALWQVSGTASSKVALGAIVPQHRSRMGSVSTGPADAQIAGSLQQSFEIQEGVTSFPLSFKYAFVTEEYPEFVGSEFDDSLRVTLLTPNGQERILAEESVNESSFIAISGIDFPGGDDTVGWTGWQSVSINVIVTAGAGTYIISLSDAGDAIYDTETLVDDIKFESTVSLDLLSQAP